jgi:hypothetical protein
MKKSSVRFVIRLPCVEPRHTGVASSVLNTLDDCGRLRVTSLGAQASCPRFAGTHAIGVSEPRCIALVTAWGFGYDQPTFAAGRQNESKRFALVVCNKLSVPI